MLAWSSKGFNLFAEMEDPTSGKLDNLGPIYLLVMGKVLLRTNTSLLYFALVCFFFSYGRLAWMDRTSETARSVKASLWCCGSKVSDLMSPLWIWQGERDGGGLFMHLPFIANTTKVLYWNHTRIWKWLIDFFIGQVWLAPKEFVSGA